MFGLSRRPIPPGDALEDKIFLRVLGVQGLLIIVMVLNIGWWLVRLRCYGEFHRKTSGGAPETHAFKYQISATPRPKILRLGKDRGP